LCGRGARKQQQTCTSAGTAAAGLRGGLTQAGRAHAGTGHALGATHAPTWFMVDGHGVWHSPTQSPAGSAEDRPLSDNGLPAAPRLHSAASWTRSSTATSVRGVWAKRSSQRGASKRMPEATSKQKAPPVSWRRLPRCLLPHTTTKAPDKLNGARHSQRLPPAKSSKQA
jgi:hypothetical protein